MHNYLQKAVAIPNNGVIDFARGSHGWKRHGERAAVWHTFSQEAIEIYRPTRPVVRNPKSWSAWTYPVYVRKRSLL